MTDTAIQMLISQIQAGELETAEQQVTVLLQSTPSATLYNIQASIALQKGAVQTAAKAFRKAFQLEPRHPEHTINLLKCLQQQENTKELVHICKQLKPEYADADLAAWVSQFWFQHTKIRYGLRWLKALYTQDPKRATQHFKHLLEQTSELRQACLHILGTSPFDAKILNQLGLVFFQDNDYPNAIAAWQKLTTLEPYPRHYNNLGAAWQSLSEYSQAKAAFEQALQIDTDFHEAHFNLGLLALKVDQSTQAEEYFKHCLKADPETYLQALFQQAETYLKQKSFRAARCCFTLCLPHHAQLKISEDLLHRGLATIADQLCETQTYQIHIAKAKKVSPPMRHRMQELFSLPLVYQNKAEIKHYRQQISSGLAEIEHYIKQQNEKKIAPDLILHPYFQLAYQAENDRPIMEQLGRIYQSQFTNSLPNRPLQQRSQIRVCFVSQYFYKHSISVCYTETIKNCAANPALQTAIFYLNDYVDQHTLDLKHSVDHFIQTSRHPISNRPNWPFSRARSMS